MLQRTHLWCNGILMPLAFIIMSVQTISASNLVVESSCPSYRTQTQGGWGSKPSGNNPATYLYTHFYDVFPNGLSIGCGANEIRLTSPLAVTNFLPSGSRPRALDKSYTDPGRQYKNVFAGQVAALTLNVFFDLYDSTFAQAQSNLLFQRIDDATFGGYTVEEILHVANQALGGCSNEFAIRELNTIITRINESFVDGQDHNTLIACETELMGGMIGDLVWLDRNGDGNYDTDEPVLKNKSIRLIDPGTDGILNTDDDRLKYTQTDLFGRYAFNNLRAGIFEVRVSDYDLIDSFICSTGTLVMNVILNANDSILDADFGFVKPGKIQMIVQQSQPMVFNFVMPITYTFKLSNIGMADLDSIILTDSQFTPVYISGDENSDDRLNSDEIWTYQYTRTWTWTTFERIKVVSGNVSAWDVIDIESNDEASITTRLLSANMEISASDDTPAPGDTITIRLTTRLKNGPQVPDGHDAQLIDVYISCNVLYDGNWLDAGPESLYWPIFESDYENNSEGAFLNALDADDYVNNDNGFGEPDWVHEFDFVVPDTTQENILITAKDTGLLHYYDGEHWSTFSGIPSGKDSLILYVQGNQNLQVHSAYLELINQEIEETNEPNFDKEGVCEVDDTAEIVLGFPMNNEEIQNLFLVDRQGQIIHQPIGEIDDLRNYLNSRSDWFLMIITNKSGKRKFMPMKN